MNELKYFEQKLFNLYEIVSRLEAENKQMRFQLEVLSSLVGHERHINQDMLPPTSPPVVDTSEVK